MRIVTGRLKGRVVPYSPQKVGKIRLTATRLKESLFTGLGADLSGYRFLDLCAGGGQMGLEAFSRGAQTALNEPDRGRFLQLQQLCRAWGIDHDVSLYNLKAEILISNLQHQGKRFDCVYADPPYHSCVGNEALAIHLLRCLGVATFMNPDGLVFVQYAADLNLPATAGSLTLERRRRYGNTGLATYRPA